MWRERRTETVSVLVSHTATISRGADKGQKITIKLKRSSSYKRVYFIYQLLIRQQDVEEKKYADSDDKVKERQNHGPNLSLFQNVKRQEDVDGQKVVI